jgi:hypothetical protein
MEGNHANLEGEAKPCVEPAPDVELIVSYGGKRETLTLKPGDDEIVKIGQIPVKLRVGSVKRKKIRPASKPPYHWVIKTASWSDRIRAMDEENARRLFYQRFGTDENIVEIYPEIS